MNQELQSARNLTNVAYGSALVSIFIGGFVLDVLGLVCGVVALHKVSQAVAGNGANAHTLQLRKKALGSIVVCAIMMILNFFSSMMYIMSPDFQAQINAIMQGGAPAGTFGLGTPSAKPLF